MKKFEKVYYSKLTEIPKASEDIERFCEENGIDSALCFPILLSLDELFTNIITYGYNCDEKQEIIMEVSLKDDSIKLVIKDSAPEFDPFSDAPEPELDGTLSERKIGGLGIFFIKKNMDEVKYMRKDGMNVVTLLKKIKKDANA